MENVEARIRVRAKLEIVDKKTLKITEIPFGTTTSDLIDSILKANEKGKIKIKKVLDNTAKDVEILIELPTANIAKCYSGCVVCFLRL